MLLVGEKMNDVIGYQVNLDCYECDKTILNDINKIKLIIKRICEQIGASVVLEQYYMFEPYGVSAYAIITTSHVAIHTWPEYGFAAIDIFSCKSEIKTSIEPCIKEYLNTKKINATYYTRGSMEAVNSEKNFIKF